MTSSGDGAFDRMWSRRQFLQRTGIGGAALLSAGTLVELLEACAGPTTTTTTGNVKASWTNVVIPENLDPHIGFDTDTLQFTHNVYEALLEYTPGGLEVRPLLAESMPAVSSDGLTYTFKIRQGVTFHDGAKLDAQAVLTSFNRLREINQGPASYLINIAGFEAPDANTFVIKLSAPYSLFPGTVPWFLIASPNAISSNKTSSDPWSKNWFASKSAGTGPYMLDSLKPNNRIDMSKNPHYWREFKAGVPISVAIIQQANTTTQLESLQSGQTDFLSNIGPDNAETAKSLPNVAVVRQPAIQLRTIPLNMIRAPLTDVRVRQALIAAFDYEGYTNFYKGFGRPANSPIPPQMANDATSPPMTFLNVFPNTPDPALVIRVSYHSSNVPAKGGYNWANFKDPQLDADLDKVVQIQDEAQRNQLLAGMQKKIVDSASTIYCIAPDLVMPVRKEWAHVKYDPFFQDGIIRWFYWSKES